MSLTARQLATLKEIEDGPVKADILSAKALAKFAALGWCRRTSEAPKIYEITDAGRLVLHPSRRPADPTPPAPAAPAQRGLFDE